MDFLSRLSAEICSCPNGLKEVYYQKFLPEARLNLQKYCTNALWQQTDHGQNINMKEYYTLLIVI